jgi:flagellar motility protein MotE (MotC chaperone)
MKAFIFNEMPPVSFNFILICFLLLLLILIPAYSTADFYEYTDNNGVLHFTDNPADVPKDQRASLKPHAEIKSNDAAIQNTENAFDDVLKAIEEAAQKAKIEDIELQREKLNTIEAELEAERKRLEQEKEELQNQKKKQSATPLFSTTTNTSNSWKKRSRRII